MKTNRKRNDFIRRLATLDAESIVFHCAKHGYTVTKEEVEKVLKPKRLSFKKIVALWNKVENFPRRRG